MPSSVSRTSSSRLLLALIVGVSFATSAAAQPAWISTDVGAASDVGIAGSAVETNGVWTIEGAGRDVWGSTDAFHFLYHPVEGWYQLVVRVDNLQNTNPYAKVGLMLRASLDASAATVILDVKPNGEIEWMARPSDGGEMLYIGGEFARTPVWLQLDWRANT